MDNCHSDSTDRPIQIVGGGLAGLTAAIKLAEHDREVMLYDLPEVRSESDSCRSVHTSRFHMDRTCSFLDLDISGCFEKVESETTYLYGRRISRKRSRAFACERGNGIKSLDHYLKTTALKKGVKFNYLPAAEISKRLSGGRTILATGLNRSAFRELDIKHTKLSGYEAMMVSSNSVTLTSYKDKYTNQDFAYMASKNGILYTLLFSRNGVDTTDLEHYKAHLLQTTGLSFPKWSRVAGSVPLEYNLFKGDYVLAGTLSGIIDPFFLSGVIGALVSGRIAAVSMIDPANAAREFRRCVKNFRIKQRLYRVMQSRLLPDRLKILVIILHTLFRDVGKL